MPWERPASVPVGQVWSRFKGREREGKTTHMYQIRDMDPSISERCLDFMEEVFMRDEPLCKLLDLSNDPESIIAIRTNWKSYMIQNVTLACFTEVDGEPDELVGFNIIVVKTKDDPDEDIDQVRGETWKKLLRILVEAESLVNVFEYYGVDKFLTSSGLTVLPDHRGQNIGARLFAAREPLCKALGVDATATVFTANSSQVLAAKCGYEVLAELEYMDMMKYGINLAGCETPRAKFMGMKFKK